MYGHGENVSFQFSPHALDFFFFFFFFLFDFVNLLLTTGGCDQYALDNLQCLDSTISDLNIQN
jgi:hypothetical protein